MRMLITVLLLFMLASNIYAVGNGVDLYEKLSTPKIAILAGTVFIFFLITIAAVFLFFMYVFKDRKE